MFHGQFSYLAIDYDCKIVHENSEYSNAEIMFLSLKASFCGDEQLADEIAVSTTTAEARELLVELKVPKSWNNTEKTKAMKLVNTLKFDQHEYLAQKLRNIKGDIYHCCFEKFWGCGMALSQKKYIKANSIPGKNYLGSILMEVRDELDN